MLYMGILVIGLGILTTVAGLICLAIASFSQEITIRQYCKKLATRVLPLAILLLFVGSAVLGYLLGF